MSLVTILLTMPGLSADQPFRIFLSYGHDSNEEVVAASK